MQTFDVHALDCWIMPSMRGGSGEPKPITRISPDGRRCTYPSIAAAARDTGSLSSSIQNALYGRTKTACGYRWEYAGK